MKKPTKSEDQHVWQAEQLQSRQKMIVQQQATDELEKLRLKELHWMHCPKCGHKLVEEKHGSVEVDLCPSCRGVWLDLNELESIVANEGGFLKAFQHLFAKP